MRLIHAIVHVLCIRYLKLYLNIILEEMEKNMAFASGSTQPSAPPPSAPPSYEEAVENAARISRQPNIPVGIPYPVGPSSMPMSSSMPRTYYFIFIL